MKSNSFLVRLSVMMLITLVTALILAGYLMFNNSKEVINEEIHEELYVIINSMQWAMSPLIEAEDSNAIMNLVNEIGSYELIESVKIIGHDYHVIYSDVPKEHGQIYMNQTVHEIFSTNAEIESKEDPDNGVYEAAVPIRKLLGQEWDNPSGEIVAVLFVSVDVDYVTGKWSELLSRTLIIFIVSNLIIFIAILSFSYMEIGRPLKAFTKAAHEISNKNYDAHIDTPLHGELADMNIAFSKMQENIKSYIKELGEAKRSTEEASDAKMIFLTNMSHEIRTPLNTILGFTELLEEQETDPEKLSDLKIVHKSGSHLLSVINDLLDFSKIEKDQMDVESIEFNVREVVRDTSDFFNVQFRSKNIDYTYGIDPSVPFICLGDMNKFRQIFINIISNAIKFTSDGEISVEVWCEDKALYVSVIDSGIGIAKDKIKSIFEPFTQTDDSVARKYGGTGLGLAICKRFANLLNGDVTVESRLDEGTKFTFWIAIEPTKREVSTGASLLCTWLNVDSELSDLVYDAVRNLPNRMDEINKAYKVDDIGVLKSQVHALKGLTGNFQMMALYELFVEADSLLKNEVIDLEAVGQCLTRINELIEQVLKAAMNECKMLDHASDSKMQSETDDLLPTHSLKLLIAEDIYENQLLLKKMLADLVTDIDVAGNGIEALEKMRLKDYDCLLLDIQMPEMSGEDVLTYFQNRPASDNIKRPYTIVLTAHATVDEKELCINLGADDYIAKPINKVKLKRTIRNLMM